MKKLIFALAFVLCLSSCTNFTCPDPNDLPHVPGTVKIEYVGQVEFSALFLVTLNDSTQILICHYRSGGNSSMIKLK